MKKIALTLALSLGAGQVLAHGGIDITNPYDHATRTELKAETTARINGDKQNAAAIATEASTRASADTALGNKIDSNKSAQDKVNTQLGAEINTQAKYTTSVNEDLQASKAAGAAAYNHVQGQISTTNGKVDAVNADLQSSKAAGVAAYGELKGNIGDVNSDLQASKAQAASAIGAVDSKANAINDDLQYSKAAGAAAVAEQAKVNASQAATNGHVQQQITDVNGKAVNAQNTADVAVGLGQKGINDAYNAQQTANHAEGTAQKAGNDAYNAQQTADYAVGVGQKNGNDIVNLQNTTTAIGAQTNVNTTNIAKNTTSINNLNTVTSQHTTQISNLDQRTTVNTTNIATNTTNIAKNTSDIKATNVVVNQHTQQIATIQDVNAVQQTQINNNTSVNARQDETLGQHATAINSLSGQTQALIDYSRDMDQRLGGRLDSLQSENNRNKREIGTAKNMAVAGLAVANMQFCTGQECGFQIAGAVANMEGKNGLAFGAGGAVSENVFINGAFTTAGSVTGVSAGVTYRIH